MSHLWRCYQNDDVDKLRRLLASASHGTPKSTYIGHTHSSQSPGASTSLGRSAIKGRKSSGHVPTIHQHAKGAQGGGAARADINTRDHAGLTILLRVASSTTPTAIEFAQVLLDHPAIDIYAQDPESGWNALHRALYCGNISTARLLLETERKAVSGGFAGNNIRGKSLIKTKDHEGHSPFDLYHKTVGSRLLVSDDATSDSDDESGSDAKSLACEAGSGNSGVIGNVGDELFFFGSNKNLTLGLGDEDDRQHPERVYLQRPHHLLQRFHHEFLQDAQRGEDCQSKTEMPTLVRYKRLEIRDVVLSKLHTAVLTTDKVSNLYVCGIGRGGRLGLGDQNTRFTLTPVQGGLGDKHVTKVTLGQHHTMAVTDNGELWTWGLNNDCQLGYALPEPAEKGQDPMVTSPRQVFGPLKREIILGAAASAIHSVAITATGMYAWGKNVGQLALMDADSRSLEYQTQPRKVVAATGANAIVMVTAIDKATVCLQANRTVCVYTSYGYNVVKFPDIYQDIQLHVVSSLKTFKGKDETGIAKIAVGGETIVAVTQGGDLFSFNLRTRDEAQNSASTTNPTRIKAAVSPPQCIWIAKQDGVHSVDVSENGSVIISTRSGAVWRRVKRSKPKDSYVGVSDAIKQKDFKFQRVPGITNIVAVRSSGFGAFAALRKDSEVISQNTLTGVKTLWDDLAPLNSLRGFRAIKDDKQASNLWDRVTLGQSANPIAHEVLKSIDLEADLASHFEDPSTLDGRDMLFAASTLPQVQIPVHRWVVTARSPGLRQAVHDYRTNGTHDHTERFIIDTPDDDDNDRLLVTFVGADILAVLNVVLHMYEDKVIPAWYYTKQHPASAFRYRQLRVDVMKLATSLGMGTFEATARTQNISPRSMDIDLRLALKDDRFFDDANVVLELDGGEILAHSSLLSKRCPFFQGLFHGRSQGMWLADRRRNETDHIPIDLKHIDYGTFQYVLRHLYTDCGEEMFDAVVTENLDDFSDLVLDVLAAANELMLDRLSQICQHVLAPLVNPRNVADFVNAVAPCSVDGFKKAGYEYMCLQMENLLENHLLDELDQDLIMELDEAVRENQQAQAPFASSDRSEAVLFERYPQLAAEVDEERRRRVSEMAFKAAHKGEERRASSSYKARTGSFGDGSLKSPLLSASHRQPRSRNDATFSPDLRPSSPHGDLMFDMEDEGISLTNSPSARAQKRRPSEHNKDIPELSTLSPGWRAKDKAPMTSHQSPPPASPLTRLEYGSLDSPLLLGSSPSPRQGAVKAGTPWASTALPTSKLDLRELLTESRPGPSALTSGLAAQKAALPQPKPSAPKMSQKERKKQQQQAQIAQVMTQAGTRPDLGQSTSEPRPGPWKTKSHEPKPRPAPVVVPQPPSTQPPKPPVKDQLLIPVLEHSKSLPRRTASPDTRFSGQRRSSNVPPTTSSNNASAPTAALKKPEAPLVPHSKNYLPPKARADAILGLNISEIIEFEQQEQQDNKDAVAKRNLQDIQQEQEFQEWWDNESRLAQEEEARRTVRQSSSGGNGLVEGKTRGVGRKGRGQRGRGRSSVGVVRRPETASSPVATGSVVASSPAAHTEPHPAQGSHRHHSGRSHGRGEKAHT